MQRHIGYNLLLLLFATLMACGGCESSPPTQAPTQTAEQASSAIGNVRITELSMAVQRLRDRDFKKPPTFEAVQSLDRRSVGATDELRDDKRALWRALFAVEHATSASTSDLPETAIAQYDAQNHTIRYVASHSPTGELERALVLAMVEALDSENFASLPPAKSWSEELANGAVLRGTGVFVWASMLAEDKGVDKETLARRPEAALTLGALPRIFAGSQPKKLPTIEDISSHVDAFERREGFSLVSSLFRSGGWSTAELARISPPAASPWVVRPDRWLSGEDWGTWKLSTRSQEILENLPQKGRVQGAVGPGIAAMWLGHFMDERLARSLYVSMQSDNYQYIPTESGFVFTWLSLWKTPADAEQIVNVFDAALRTLPGAKYTVLRNGVTIAVVGASDTQIWNEDARLNLAAALAESGPLFSPGEKEIVTFHPSTFDAYSLGAERSNLDVKASPPTWTDPAAKLELNLAAIQSWNLQQTQNSTARWVAKYEADGSTILMNTELFDVFGPAFNTEEYRKAVVQNLQSSMTNTAIEADETVDHPQSGRTHHVRIAGELDKIPAVIDLWMFRVGDVIVTLSLKAWPDVAAKHVETIARVMDGLQIDQPETREKSDPGIIRFKIEN